jgi:hypothetical protein
LAQAYPPAVLNRAKELWIRVVPNTQPLSTEAVAKIIRQEFGVSLTKKTVAEWIRAYGWTRSDDVAVTVMPPTAPQVPTLVSAQQGSEPHSEEEIDWEYQRARFLAKLAGVAEQCLAIVIDPADGLPKLAFRDDDSRFKTGMAAVELMGKINSGKFDPPEDGDKVPMLKPEDVKAVVAFFIKGGSPEPKLRSVIDMSAIPVEDSGDSDGQNTRGSQTRRLSAPDRERDKD